MYLNFKNIIISNFMSFAHTEMNLELNNRGFTLVKGINNNPVDEASSNGCGKSAIWEAISWCLTGETIRGIKGNLVNLRNSSEGCYVTLHFDIENHHWVVTRSIDSKNSSGLRFWIDGVEKSGKGIRDTEKVFKEYLPDLTSTLLGSVVILGQGLPQRFTNNTPSGRKEVLEKLSKSDFMIEDIKERLTTRQNFLLKELRTISDEEIKLNSQKDIYTSALESDNKALSELKPLEYYDEQIKHYSEEMERKRSIVDQLQKNIDETQQLLKDKQLSLNNAKYERTNEKSRLDMTYKVSINSSESEKRSEEASLRQTKEQILKLESITDVCPTCGQKLHGVIKPDTSELHVLADKTQQTIDKLADTIAKYRKEYERELEKINAEFEANTAELTQSIANLQQRIAEVKQQVASPSKELDTLCQQLYNAKAVRQSAISDKENLAERIKNYEHSLQDIQDKILYNNVRKEEFDARYSVVNKMLTLAKRDFRGFLLSNTIDFISKKAKEYSYALFNTDRVQFQLDGNNIFIGYDDKPYENLSGGERQKIDIIVQFALRDMLCKLSNFSSNILVLDELFDGLDSMGCQKVIDIITQYLTDVESVFIITHHADIAVPADSVITVEKNQEGISTIK